jgi:hypothetical protein
MNAAVIVFPGSNCDRDVATALEQAMGKKPIMAWHGNADLPQVDLVVLPGGFSYGDYLRCGAMAAQSPVMREVVARARAGTRARAESVHLDECGVVGVARTGRGASLAESGVCCRAGVDGRKREESPKRVVCSLRRCRGQLEVLQRDASE